MFPLAYTSSPTLQLFSISSTFHKEERKAVAILYDSALSVVHIF